MSRSLHASITSNRTRSSLRRNTTGPLLAGLALMSAGAGWLVITSPAALGQPGTPPPSAQEASGEDKRIPVRAVDDLPRHTYTITGTALEFLDNEEAVWALLDEMVADVKSDLATYRIEDPSTLRQYYDFLANAAILRKDWETALKYTEMVRELESKEIDRLMRGQTLHAWVRAVNTSGRETIEDERFASAFKSTLRKSIDALPYEVVKDRLIQARNAAQIITADLIRSSAAVQMDPVLAANNGVVSGDVAAGIINLKFTLDFALPILPHVAEVYGAVIDANVNAVAAADLWAPRLVSLAGSAKAEPVVVGIWDSGVDTSLYRGHLWTNRGETKNGRDDDGNGFVDDLHGIAFSEDHRPTTGDLANISDLKGDLKQAIDFVAASQDMQAGIENEGVRAFRAHYAGLRGDALKDFQEDMGLIGNYTHGTHVAGIAIDGNPFARILHVTENFPHKMIPDEAPSVEAYRRWGQASQQAVDYLKAADAKVVNMSWRIPRAAVEALLQAKGVGANEEERAEMSREIFAAFREGLESAIASAPDILFIAGAGNEDNDLDFNEYVPAGLRLPNLITVSAIDHTDKPAAFTSFGKDVVLYANGYRIESMVPGGRRIEFSGTSMSAPQVSNLAAKILALKPNLTPAEVIKLMKDNADPLPGHDGRLIINPRRTIEAIAPAAIAEEGKVN